MRLIFGSGKITAESAEDAIKALNGSELTAKNYGQKAEPEDE
ncbi:MAG: hypothetical protein ABJA66_15345 [Actinomycetota bacterium]